LLLSFHITGKIIHDALSSPAKKFIPPFALGFYLLASDNQLGKLNLLLKVIQ
jgi:hypothetical protein